MVALQIFILRTGVRFPVSLHYSLGGIMAITPVCRIGNRSSILRRGALFSGGGNGNSTRFERGDSWFEPRPENYEKNTFLDNYIFNHFYI